MLHGIRLIVGPVVRAPMTLTAISKAATVPVSRQQAMGGCALQLLEMGCALFKVQKAAGAASRRSRPALAPRHSPGL